MLRAHPTATEQCAELRSEIAELRHQKQQERRAIAEIVRWLKGDWTSAVKSAAGEILVEQRRLDAERQEVNA